MIDENLLKAKVEDHLKNFKQWKDQYGITWIEVNGKKFPKNQFAYICLEEEYKNLS